MKYSKSKRFFTFKLKLNLFLLSAYCLSACSTSNKQPIPRPAPAYTKLQLLNGSYRSLRDLRGKTVVLSFWSMHCSSSKSLIKKLNATASEQTGKTQAVFYTVNLDREEDFEKLEGFIRSNKLNFLTHAFSGNAGNDEAALLMEVEVVPMIFVIDPQGMIMASGRNMDTVKEALQQ